MKKYSDLTIHERINLKYNCFGYLCLCPVFRMLKWKKENHTFSNCSFLFCPDYANHTKNY